MARSLSIIIPCVCALIPIAAPGEPLPIAARVGHYSVGRHLMNLEDKSGAIPEPEILSGASHWTREKSFRYGRASRIPA